ncbi:MAG TPA: hypothetical protein VFN79_05255 [Steroidobacteraceae bacterium]|nr:hypothetical protein [Steroidobacteraceae bacterium]
MLLPHRSRAGRGAWERHAEVRIIRAAEDLVALQPQWWRLWRGAGAAPFLAPAWLLPWWQCFRPGELRSLAVLDDGRLAAL